MGPFPWECVCKRVAAYKLQLPCVPILVLGCDTDQLKAQWTQEDYMDIQSSDNEDTLYDLATREGTVVEAAPILDQVVWSPKITFVLWITIIIIIWLNMPTNHLLSLFVGQHVEAVHAWHRMFSKNRSGRVDTQQLPWSKFAMTHMQL
jgi:hypothetical protein